MRTLRLTLVCLSLVLVVPAAARAADVVGIGDQSAAMFRDPHFKRLDIHVSRLIVSWDAVYKRTFEVPYIDEWVAAVTAAKIEPLIAFNHTRGCYDGKSIPRTRACRLPSVAEYRRAFIAFRQRYPRLRVYSPWNEANHVSQPTSKRPDRAAAYYNVVRSLCRGCKIVACDVLDQAKMGRYLKAFQKHAKGKPRIWGLHNYQDTNNYTTSGTREMLRSVKGEIWLTETGGIVKLGRNRPFNPRRAAKATRFMFKLAKSNERVKRLYIYQWFGQARTARFDAGLVTRKADPRPAYWVVHSHLKRPGGNPEPAPVPPPPPPAPSPSPSPTPAPTPTPTPFCIPLVSCP